MGAAWPGRALPLPPAGRAGRRSGVGGAVEFPGLVGPRALARPAPHWAPRFPRSHSRLQAFAPRARSPGPAGLCGTRGGAPTVSIRSPSRGGGKRREAASPLPWPGAGPAALHAGGRSPGPAASGPRSSRPLGGPGADAGSSGGGARRRGRCAAPGLRPPSVGTARWAPPRLPGPRLRDRDLKGLALFLCASPAPGPVRPAAPALLPPWAAPGHWRARPGRGSPVPPCPPLYAVGAARAQGLGPGLGLPFSPRGGPGRAPPSPRQVREGCVDSFSCGEQVAPKAGPFCSLYFILKLYLMLLYERGGAGRELSQSPLRANVLFITRVSEISCEAWRKD